MNTLTFDEVPAHAPPSGQLATKLWHHKQFVVLVAIPIFLGLVAAAQFLPSSYKATAAVSVDTRAPRPPVRGSDVVNEAPTQFTEDIIGTEMAMLGSRELLSDVADRLHLENDPHFNPYLSTNVLGLWKDKAFVWLQQYVDMPRPQPVTTNLAASTTVDNLVASVKFNPVPRSRVIEITVSTWNASLAADIANLVASRYIDTHLAIIHDAAENVNRFLTKELEDLKANATKTSDAVENYRLAHGLMAGAQTTLVQEQVTVLDTQLLDARAKLGALQADYNSAQHGNPEQLSSVINSPTITRLRDEEAIALGKRADIASRYGPQAPQLAAYDSMVASARNQIAAEAARRVHSMTSDLQAAQRNVDALTSRVNALRVQLGDMNAARGHLETLQAESVAANALYGTFLNRSKEADASMLFPSTDIRIMSHAIPPTNRAFPQNRYTVPASGMIALLLSSLLCLMFESRDSFLHTTRDIEAAFGIAAIGLIPLQKRSTKTLYDEAIEQLLNRICYDLNAKTVLITSALPKEGKTTTAKALVAAAAARGIRVLLVDADMRSQPSPRRIVGSSAGFADVLGGAADVNAVTQYSQLTNVALMPVGKVGESPIRLLSRPTAQDALTTLSNRFDLVIIDGPPVLVGGDCWMLGRQAEHTIMIVKWGETAKETLGTAINHLQTSRSDVNHMPRQPVSGIVLNMIDTAKSYKRRNNDAVWFSKSLERYRRARTGRTA